MESIFVWDNGWRYVLGERTQMDKADTELTDDELDALTEDDAQDYGVHATLTDMGQYWRLIIEDIPTKKSPPTILWSANYERKSIAIQECADYGIDPEEIEYL